MDVAPVFAEIFSVVAGVFAVLVQVSAVAIDVALVFVAVSPILGQVTFVVVDVSLVLPDVFAIGLVACLAIFFVVAEVAAVFVEVSAVAIDVSLVLIAIGAVFTEVAFVLVDIFLVFSQVTADLASIFFVILKIGLGESSGPESEQRQSQQVCKKSSHIVWWSPLSSFQILIRWLTCLPILTAIQKNSCSKFEEYYFGHHYNQKPKPTTEARRNSVAEPQPKFRRRFSQTSADQKQNLAAKERREK